MSSATLPLRPGSLQLPEQWAADPADAFFNGTVLDLRRREVRVVPRRRPGDASRNRCANQLFGGK